MGRIFGIIKIDGRECHTLFDSGARNSYIAEDAAKGLATTRLPVPRASAIGGMVRHAAGTCSFVGSLQGKQIEVDAYVLEDIGRDEHGHTIDILFGALAMQKWGIRLVPEEERLDLTHFSAEFIEYLEECRIG